MMLVKQKERKTKGKLVPSGGYFVIMNEINIVLFFCIIQINQIIFFKVVIIIINIIIIYYISFFMFCAVPKPAVPRDLKYFNCQSVLLLHLITGHL